MVFSRLMRSMSRSRRSTARFDVAMKAFQGLTVTCARCHDHKFDAISQRDYYALYGVFASCRPAVVTLDEPVYLAVHKQELTALKVEFEWRSRKRGLPKPNAFPSRLRLPKPPVQRRRIGAERGRTRRRIRTVRCTRW
jgi:hypothetical protein